MNLLYILSGNLSTTPRALQSLKVASKKYSVEVLFVSRATIWKKIDEEVLNELKIKGKIIPLNKEKYIRWLFIAILQKLIDFTYPIFKQFIIINALTNNKAALSLLLALNRRKKTYDLIIGHSYGSLFPAYYLAKKHNIPFAFDIEDYHPGEKCSPAEKQRREFLLKKLLPKAIYLSYASPLIGNYSLDLLENPNNQKMVPAPSPSRTEQKGKAILINNSFSQNEFHLKENYNNKIQLVWFSQNITWGRGLEQIVPALAKYKHKIQLNLIGNKRPDFYMGFLKPFDDFINYTEPIPQKELHFNLANYDIGLAVEISNVDLNKDIALSNKIFAYAQSGLYILATDTSAQQQFMNEHPSLGILSAQTSEAMEIKISKIIDKIETIRANKKMRFEYAKKLAWENESRKLLDLWESI